MIEVHLTHDPAELTVDWIVLDRSLEIIDVGEKRPLFANADCPSIANQIESKACLVVEALNPYPTANPLFEGAERCASAVRAFGLGRAPSPLQSIHRVWLPMTSLKSRKAGIWPCPRRST